MSPSLKRQAPSRCYLDNTPPWINQEDLKDICSTYDEVIKNEQEGPVDFERAISLTGYGKFNYLLLLAILPAGWASIYGSTSMSYVLPSAECDLSLTMFDKGLLNSMPFAGMIVTAFFWGFLTDTYGRKKVLTYGYLTTSIFSFASCMSHASWLLILFKFINGILISGPYAALMSYLAEVHGEQQRSRIYMWLGVFFSLGHISIPCLAWIIIPQDFRIPIFNGSMDFTSWRMFLALCALPEFIAFIVLTWFPESPRFLLSKGRDDEALEVFRYIYALNTGKNGDTYAVKCVTDESYVKTQETTLLNKFQGGWLQMKPLFTSPYSYRLILIGMIQFGATIGSNTLRLWMPQLFAMIETYEASHPVGSDEEFPSICVMLEQTNTTVDTINKHNFINNTIEMEKICAPVVLNSTVYLNSIVIAVTGVIGYALAGSLINCAGKKKLMMFCFLSAGLCCGILYWAENSGGILGISSVFVALSSIGGAAVTNVIVDNFPTPLRAMAISMMMMMGRIGAVIGNLLFPLLFKLSCLGPFFMIGMACLVCAILVFFIPAKKSDFKESIESA
ncbi:synaptic vesicle glycoprotein 2B isoform X2 [Fopius arisanus]|uniref:Synaptic vesicle glycoprotein 2B isoform X2 n=1 Tax=Fopius arisanus TaxID=64838 RepID=A0A9R1T0J8_9HYME|nr:PREDICTED: synaptic vesicle glycoprotein 2B-like isoform X2 [Fopius arisanus]